MSPTAGTAPAADTAPIALVVRNALGVGSGPGRSENGRSQAGMVDIRVAGGVIVEIGPDLDRLDGDVLDAGGRLLLPGLHDHHIHLAAWAAAQWSVFAGPPAVTGADRFAEVLRAAAARVPAASPDSSGPVSSGPDSSGPVSSGWLRVTGYHESVAGLLDRYDLDRLVAGRPVRVQHRSGALWMLNSAALRQLGLTAEGSGRDPAAVPAGLERDRAGRPTGRLWRGDRWLSARLSTLGQVDPDRPRAELARLSALAATRGITGFTDATPDRSAADARWLGALKRDGTLLQNLVLMVGPATGPIDQVAGVRPGPEKVILDDADLPPLEDLAARFSAAHSAGRNVAVHAVTAVQLAVALAAWEGAGVRPGDRLEHAAVVPPEAVPVLAARGLAVATQPGFVAARGDDYLRDVPAAEHPYLWRAGTLSRAGVTMAAGSDAPYGPWDPWVGVTAAVTRGTRDGRRVAPEEAVPVAEALRWYWADGTDLSHHRSVAVGQAADLMILDATDPGGLADGAAPVLATLIGGRVVHRLL